MMNSKERFRAALSISEADRVPVFYQHLGGASWVLARAEETIRDGFRDPRVFADICRASRDAFGYDNVMAGWGDILIEAHAHGTEWRFPEKDYYPRPVRYAVQEPGDADRLEPIDPLEDEYWSVPVRAAGLLQAEVGGEVEVVGCINSPFAIASAVRGYMNLIADTVVDPDCADKVLSVLVESLRRYGERIETEGLETVFIEDGTAGAEQITLDLCEHFDIRYLKEVVECYRSLGLRTIVHNCSSSPYISAQASLDPDAIHFNNKYVDVERTFEELRGRTCLIAGVDHQDTMFRKPAEMVEDEVKRTIEAYGGGPGLMIGPGCEMPFKAPLENIIRLREAAEKYGRT